MVPTKVLIQMHEKLDEMLQICIDRGDYTTVDAMIIHRRLNDLDEQLEDRELPGRKYEEL